MRCYHTIDEETKERVLIPGCMAVAVSNDIERCTCRKTAYQIERKEYLEKLQARDEEIKECYEEIERLVSLLEK